MSKLLFKLLLLSSSSTLSNSHNTNDNVANSTSLNKIKSQHVKGLKHDRKKNSHFYFITLILFLLLIQLQIQITLGSRKFLTGLIIGTLLARNGMQPGPSYSPPVQYPSHSGGQQQPLFIIIPSAGKSKPHVMPQPAPYYEGGHQHGHYEYPHRRSILKPNKQSASYQQQQQNHQKSPSSLNSKASKLLGRLGLDVSRSDLIEQQQMPNKHSTTIQQDGDHLRRFVKVSSGANIKKRPSSSSSSSPSASLNYNGQETPPDQDSQQQSQFITDLNSYTNELNVDAR